MTHTNAAGRLCQNITLSGKPKAELVFIKRVATFICGDAHTTKGQESREACTGNQHDAKVTV
jgi:hypothetical protein